MTSFYRINSSSIDTQKEINFIFNGQKYTGFQGDTLASALIANGIKLMQVCHLENLYIFDH